MHSIETLIGEDANVLDNDIFNYIDMKCTQKIITWENGISGQID